MLERIGFFLAFIADQCLPNKSDASPTIMDYALVSTIVLLVFFAAYALLKGLTRQDSAAAETIKTNILRE